MNQYYICMCVCVCVCVCVCTFSPLLINEKIRTQFMLLAQMAESRFKTTSAGSKTSAFSTISAV